MAMTALVQYHKQVANFWHPRFSRMVYFHFRNLSLAILLKICKELRITENLKIFKELRHFEIHVYFLMLVFQREDYSWKC